MKLLLVFIIMPEKYKRKNIYISFLNFIQVVYDARGFLEKNRDNLSANLIECMEKSGIELISYLFNINDETNSTPDTHISSM